MIRGILIKPPEARQHASECQYKAAKHAVPGAGAQAATQSRSLILFFGKRRQSRKSKQAMEFRKLEGCLWNISRTHVDCWCMALLMFYYMIRSLVSTAVESTSVIARKDGI